MFLTRARFIYVIGVLGTCVGVIMDPSTPYLEGSNSIMGFTETFQSCLRENTGASILLPCFNKGALAGIVDASDSDAVDISEGVVLERDPNDKSPRMVIPMDMNPMDFRSVLDAAAMLMKQRSLRYDMSMLHPGLVMRVGPTLDGTGVLEFVMDRHYPSYTDRATGTGRLIARQVLLPLLLGFKLPLVTLVPLILGALILIAKKAFIISKVAMVISGLLGISAYYGFPNRPHHGVGGPGFGPPIHEPPISTYKGPEILDNEGGFLSNFGFRSGNQMFRGVNAPRDNAEAESLDVHRNFAWEKREKAR